MCVFLKKKIGCRHKRECLSLLYVQFVAKAIQQLKKKKNSKQKKTKKLMVTAIGDQMIQCRLQIIRFYLYCRMLADAELVGHQTHYTICSVVCVVCLDIFSKRKKSNSTSYIYRRITGRTSANVYTPLYGCCLFSYYVLYI